MSLRPSAVHLALVAGLGLTPIVLLAQKASAKAPVHPPSMVENQTDVPWVVRIDDLLVPVGVLEVWDPATDKSKHTSIKSSGQMVEIPARSKRLLAIQGSPKTNGKNIAITLGFGYAPRQPKGKVVSLVQLNVKQDLPTMTAGVPSFSYSPAAKLAGTYQDYVAVKEANYRNAEAGNWVTLKDPSSPGQDSGEQALRAKEKDWRKAAGMNAVDPLGQQPETQDSDAPPNARDYWRLNLKPASTKNASDVVRNYRKVSLVVHPDKHADDPESATVLTQWLNLSRDRILASIQSRK